MINFAVISTESLVAFILAIVFTVFSLGFMFFYLKRSEKLSLFMHIMIVYILPCVSTFLWLFLILSLYVANVTTAIIVGLVAVAVVALIMFVVEKVHASHNEKEEKTQE